MTTEPPESSQDASVPDTTGTDRAVLVAVSIATIAAVFVMFFIMGFVSAWLKGEGDGMAMMMQGLKFGVSGCAGVICIGISAKSWQKVAVPPWLPLSASFAVGFFVMNGLGEALDGRYESILPKAGGGFISGCLAGLGLYWVQKKGWVKHRPLNSKSPRTPNQELP